jgi:hypothetical protein
MEKEKRKEERERESCGEEERAEVARAGPGRTESGVVRKVGRTEPV